MRKLLPPFVEIAFAFVGTAMASATERLVGSAIVFDIEAGVSTKVHAPGIVGVSRGTELVAVGPGKLALVAEAEPDGNEYSCAEAQPLRFKIRRRLIEVAAEIDFVYAAVLVEEPLESVGELVAANGGSCAFRTFALSASYFSEQIVASVLELLPEAHVERFEWGWFVTSIRNMIPLDSEACGLPINEAMERSLIVSRLLAGALRSGQMV